MEIRDYNPKNGFAFQGDIAIIPIPSDVAINRTSERFPADGRLILQEGEATGHHHAIVLDRPHKTSLVAERLMADAIAGHIPVPNARLYHDEGAVNELVRRGILTRSDLAVGILTVENGPMVVGHINSEGVRQDHDGIRLPVGNYYIGRQIESAGSEERVRAD